MTRLLDVAPFVSPASSTTLGAEILQRFETESETLAIAVVDIDGRPIGLIERNAFLVLMAAQHGYSLWSRRPATQIMKRDPVIVDGEVTVAEFCGRVLTESTADLLHGFIVTVEGRYRGVGATMALLQASAAETATYADQMQKLAWEAGEALAAKGRFLAVMSHEIRTPLNGVLAVAEIMRRKCTQSDLAPFIETILDSGGTLLRLLNDALDLSRAEAAGLQLDEAPFVVAGLVDELKGLWSSQAELKGLELQAVYEGPSELRVHTDAVRLRQVFNNLIGNAMKFTNQGHVRVKVAVRMDGDKVRLTGSVTDTGPGVPQDRTESLFLPFQQTDEGVRQGGAGLGLAVCRQIVERMDGVIHIVPTAEPGTQIEFEVLLDPLPNLELTTPVDQVAGPKEPETYDDRVHVLIADDNATNRMVAQTLCEMCGFTCDTVDNGEAAISRLAGGHFDLVLMDIKMPGIDGVEATRRIRASGGPYAGIPILALTANADPTDAAFYRQSGMDGVVEKPINPERLFVAMSRALQGDRAEDGVCAA
jgi:signal transduction histidine kinase/ActR/RegA family two-component response regulator